VVCLRVFGLNSHKKSVDFLNYFIIKCLLLLGIRVVFNNKHKLPLNRPLIIASNHQSTYDIPPLIWYFRKHFPKFIAKKELGKGFPSISYNLRHGGAVLIDRKDPIAAVSALEGFCDNIKKNRWSVVIFPEGTRSRNGQPKSFQRGGLRTLLRKIPDALLVPVTINHSWKLAQWNYFPIPLGICIDLLVHSPIDPQHNETEKVIDKLEQTIKSRIKN
jgi:1-acyl-sn-glycerol-3-phosphate acyltransferase